MHLPPRLAIECRRLVQAVFGVLALGVGPEVSAQSREVLEMEVAWTDDRCDFIVTRNDAGHGIVMRLTPLPLKIGDVLVGPLNEVGYGRKIAKQGTDDAAMMQIRKYGIRRKPALDLVYEWSRYCNTPEE